MSDVCNRENSVYEEYQMVTVWLPKVKKLTFKNGVVAKQTLYL
jgi:hypothetical protein